MRKSPGLRRWQETSCNVSCWGSARMIISRWATVRGSSKWWSWGFSTNERKEKKCRCWRNDSFSVWARSEKEISVICYWQLLCISLPIFIFRLQPAKHAPYQIYMFSLENVMSRFFHTKAHQGTPRRRHNNTRWHTRFVTGQLLLLMLSEQQCNNCIQNSLSGRFPEILTLLLWEH